MLNKDQAIVLSRKVNFGAFADVFELLPNKVVKLFRRLPLACVDRAYDAQAAECIVRAVWDSECLAYELALSDPRERQFVEQYLQRVRVADVISAGGQSAATSYHLDCAYVMRHMAGRPTKWGQLESSLRGQAIELEKRWTRLGIRHFTDAGVFGDGAIESVIDFAMADRFQALESEWHQQGRLPAEAIQRWGKADDSS
jgi:hypothetical protein